MLVSQRVASVTQVEFYSTEAAGKVNTDHYGHVKDVSNNTFAGLRIRNATARAPPLEPPPSK